MRMLVSRLSSVDALRSPANYIRDSEHSGQVWWLNKLLVGM